MTFDHTQWQNQCHAASLALLRSGELGEPARVVRGVCDGVGAQHSWLVLGNDPWDTRATVVDPTLWGWDATVEGIWRGKASVRPHTPHGSGSIWTYGKPVHCGGDTIDLDTSILTRDAQGFLAMIGPLDRRGWGVLAHAPVHGWPSKEIIGALHADERTTHLVPIDIAGMLLPELNIGGLYA